MQSPDSHELIVGSWAAQPQLNRQFNELWTDLIVERSDTNQPASPNTAITHTPIWHGLLLLGGDTGSLPMEMFRMRGETQTMETQHTASRLLGVRPHRLIAPNVWFETMTQRAIIWGNAVAEIARDNMGRPVPVRDGGGLTPLPPEHTSWEYDERGRMWITTRVLEDGRTLSDKIFIDPDDTFHIKNLTPDAFWGWSLWKQIGRDRIANGHAYLKHSNKTFSNSARPDFLFSFPVPLGQEAIENFRDELQKKNVGLDNRGRSLIIDNGMTATALSMTLEDAVFADLVKLDREMCASLLGIPSVMLNALERATFSNIEEQNRWYINRTLSRWLNKYVEEAAIKLLTPREQERFKFAWNLDSLLKGTLKDRYEAYNQAIASMWMSPNEVRKKEGMNPREGGDEFVNPNTTSGGGDAEGSGPEESAIESRLLARELSRMLKIEDDQCARAAAREKNFLNWIDEFYKTRFHNELSELLPEQATSYCVERHQFWLNQTGEVTSVEQLADRVKNQSAVRSNRVKSLINTVYNGRAA